MTSALILTLGPPYIDSKMSLQSLQDLSNLALLEILCSLMPVVTNKSGDVIVLLQNANIRLKEEFYVLSLGFNLISGGKDIRQ
eukprot:IDg21203t1